MSEGLETKRMLMGKRRLFSRFHEPERRALLGKNIAGLTPSNARRSYCAVHGPDAGQQAEETPHEPGSKSDGRAATPSRPHPIPLPRPRERGKLFPRLDDMAIAGFASAQTFMVCLLVLTLLPGCRTSESRKSAEDGSGAFATGHYRNLFAEDGHSQSEIQQKVDSAFQQLFHGDPASQAVYFAAGSNANGPLAYITDIKHHDVRTEGLSYGMIIAVELNKKAEFDALWNWSKTYLYHDSPAHPSFGFFSWQAKTNGQTMSEFVAPDGESYYVMALYFAANRWGNGQGIYNYKQQADELLSNLRHRALITGNISMLRRTTNMTVKVTAGPLFDEEHKMVLFSPSTERPKFTDRPITCRRFMNYGRVGGRRRTENFGGRRRRPAAIFLCAWPIPSPGWRQTMRILTERW